MGLVDVGNALRSRLTTAQTGDDATRAAALAAVIAAAGLRVYPGISDANTYPLISYQLQREKEESLQAQRQQEYTLTLVIVAKGAGAKLQAGAIAKNVDLLLDRQTWTVGSTGGLNGGTTRCFLNEASENVMSDAGNAETLFYEIDEEYRVWSNA